VIFGNTETEQASTEPACIKYGQEYQKLATALKTDTDPWLF